ncbi:PAP2 superfamily protein 3 [Alcaligenes faecalis subsp. faecalis NCIB 8687]|jgi:lipid A 4'-phosphatase|uniref:phosphatase PAP2 family protein n=1 Tax=unclassified Alcaligenes TaxID=259357 RepID=UPI000269E87C|nr:PAP2 superfamily protein 3 [Alcaligenes faecalis subsp. faecalis NCIB 8687]QBH20014.1 phosphatase PAP2 family protein [Alcaligenes faecalis]WGQ36177.1 phosphatase PAP2 family protein [Alcaligenes faecalis]
MLFRPYILGSAVFFLVLGVLASVTMGSATDLSLSAFFFDPQMRDFPWRLQPFVDLFGRKLVWFVPFGGAVIAAVVAWRLPRGSCRQLAWAGAAFYMGSGPLLIGVLKHLTAMPRPFNLALFGGTESMPDYFWAHSWAQAGNALPSAHAASGFVLLSLFFVGVMVGCRKLTAGGFVLGLGAGLLFGFLRIMQGYHFLSQVLASGAVLGLYGCVLFYLLWTWARHKPLES